MPLGLAAGFLVDGEELAVPMAVEEPSVIAAASFAARLIRRGGGFATWATEPVMRAQVFLEKVPAGGELRVAPPGGGAAGSGWTSCRPPCGPAAAATADWRWPACRRPAWCASTC